MSEIQSVTIRARQDFYCTKCFQRFVSKDYRVVNLFNSLGMYGATPRINEIPKKCTQCNGLIKRATKDIKGFEF